MRIRTFELTDGLPLEDLEYNAIAGAYDESGAVLLRGRSFTLDEFEDFSRGLCLDFHHVGTRQSRRRETGDGFSTEVFSSNFILFGHAEGAYRPFPEPPDVCFFHCITPPAAAGGETILVDGAAMFAALPAELRRRLEHTRVVYECLWEPPRWQVEFGVCMAAELEALLKTLPSIEYTLDEELLHLFYATPAVTRPRPGVPVFANGLLAHLPRISHPRYAGLPVYCNPANRIWFDGLASIAEGDINALIDAHDQVLHLHRWQRHDLLILDNNRHMHGRNMTVEPCERVLISRFGRLEGTMRAHVDATAPAG